MKPSYGLADAEIERMLRDSFEHAKDDMHARALHEAAGRGASACSRRYAVGARRRTPTCSRAEERAAIERQIAALAQPSLPANDHRAIKQAIDALNRATEEFAGRRMDARRASARSPAGRSRSLDL